MENFSFKKEINDNLCFILNLLFFLKLESLLIIVYVNGNFKILRMRLRID